MNSCLDWISRQQKQFWSFPKSSLNIFTIYYPKYSKYFKCYRMLKQNLINLPFFSLNRIMQKIILRVSFSVKRYVRPVPKPKCFDYIWTGTCRDPCYSFNLLAKQSQRKQLVMKCEKSRVQMKTVYTPKQKLVYKTAFQDTCLRKVVDKYCHDNKRVPNIVHYVWFGKSEFTFVHFLSFLSAYKIQNPCLIMVHADKMPMGKLWNYFLQICSKVVQVKRRQPKRVFQRKLVFVEHKADVAKLDALKGRTAYNFERITSWMPF